MGACSAAAPERHRISSVCTLLVASSVTAVAAQSRVTAVSSCCSAEEAKQESQVCVDTTSKQKEWFILNILLPV